MSTSGKLQGRQMDEGAHAHTSNNPVAQNTSYDPCRIVRRQIRDLNEIFTIRRLNSKQIESGLHDLWSLVTQTAMVIPADDPAQDRLVAEVVHAQQLRSPGTNARTADGKLWSDLPFLGVHVSEVWSANLMKIKKETKLNLAAFTARLVAAEMPGSELGCCALFVLRETLETRRGLTVIEYGRDTLVADLLPAAVAWVKFAGLTLLKSSLETETSHSEEVEDFLAVGELAQEDGILATGFSLERWHFWEKRLGQLSSVDDKEISEQALKGKEFMRKAWSDESV